MSEGGERVRGEAPLPLGRGSNGARRDSSSGKSPPQPPSPTYLANKDRATRTREAALRELIGVGHVDGRGDAGDGRGGGGEGPGAHELFRQVRT